MYTMSVPLVTVCTPTYNRRFSMKFSLMVMLKQTHSRIRWIIIDNSDDDEKSWEPITKEDHKSVEIVYHRISDEKKPIGWLRNKCIDEAMKYSDAKYIAFWDDDDYYPSQRLAKSVEALEQNPSKDIVGTDVMPVFISEENVLMEVGPYGTNHATASCWFFRASITSSRRFNDKDIKAEEGSFTRDWTLPMIMLPNTDIIMVIGHPHNTVSKRQMVENPQRFAGALKNTANAKNILRFQWFRDRELWDCFCKTFLPASGGL